ncbi:MAG: hypothetical protein AB4042_08530 [Leptolyngbyaceae cyanobacterium]
MTTGSGENGDRSSCSKIVGAIAMRGDCVSRFKVGGAIEYEGSIALLVAEIGGAIAPDSRCSHIPKLSDI